MKSGLTVLDDADFTTLDPPGLESLRDGRLFISGGTGFIGTWLLEYLSRIDRGAALGLTVVVLSRNPQAFLDAHPHLAAWPAMQMLAGDVRDLAKGSLEADWVIHGATPATRNLEGLHPLELMDIVTAGTRAVLEAVRAPRRVLFLSSGLASGIQRPDCAAQPEDGMGSLDSLDLRSAYGNAKHFAEHLCAQHGAARGFEAVVARCYAFVGPLLPLDAHFAVGNFLQDALEGRPIRIQGDGTPLRTYLHAAEMAHWLWALLIRGQGNQVYNVGGGEAVSIHALAEHIGRLGEVPVSVARAPVAGALPARYVPNIARAANELGLVPRWSWQEAVDRTWKWHVARRRKAPEGA